MIEDRKNVGTHEDQKRASRIGALKSAGIGQSYADKTLDQHPQGGPVKEWLLADTAANARRINEGYGFDIRGPGPRALDLLNLSARAFLMLPSTVYVTTLVRLPKLIASEEGQAALNVQCLLIRDFETPHDNPLRPYEIAEVEAYLMDRLTDARSVSVWRHVMQPRGWWSPTLEAMLEENARVWEVPSK